MSIWDAGAWGEIRGRLGRWRRSRRLQRWALLEQEPFQCWLREGATPEEILECWPQLTKLRRLWVVQGAPTALLSEAVLAQIEQDAHGLFPDLLRRRDLSAAMAGQLLLRHARQVREALLRLPSAGLEGQVEGMGDGLWMLARSGRLPGPGTWSEVLSLLSPPAPPAESSALHAYVLGRVFRPATLPLVTTLRESHLLHLVEVLERYQPGEKPPTDYVQAMASHPQAGVQVWKRLLHAGAAVDEIAPALLSRAEELEEPAFREEIRKGGGHVARLALLRRAPPAEFAELFHAVLRESAPDALGALERAEWAQARAVEPEDLALLFQAAEAEVRLGALRLWARFRGEEEPS